ncbi:MAG: type II toxin-antitoxin system VapC family toxin [Gammaproteobacteria bacterium]
MIVLDASALLAFLFREPGHETVEHYIEESCISTVNLSEVAGRLIRDGIEAAPLMQQITETAIEIIPFTQEQAVQAATFIPHTQRFGLSFADRACLGLARERHLPVLTADIAWSELSDIGIQIIQIR